MSDGVTVISDSAFQVIVTAWIVMNTLGLIVSTFNVLDSQKDLRALDWADINNGRRIVAHANLRSQVIHAVQCAIMLGIGLVTLADVPGRRLVSILGLMIVVVLIVANSILDRRAQVRLLRTAPPLKPEPE